MATRSGLADQRDRDERWMRQALAIAQRGQGFVEPNPMVGCVAVLNDQVIGQGFHEKFGGPHAEVNALRNLDRDSLREATIYVTLEPCAHFGKTPPCADLLCELRPKRVVVAMEDPFPKVNGTGLDKLRQVGIEVTVGVLQEEAIELNAPYLKRIQQGLPWVIAKWAMTLDGKIATSAGDSRWISNELCREKVHALRGRMDAIVVGIGTVLADDPMLNARPHGPRTARRVVLDNQARLPASSQLVRTTGDIPVLVACDSGADPDRIQTLKNAGCDVLMCSTAKSANSLYHVLSHLGSMGCTNVLIEGGSEVLGTARDIEQIDEVHAFVAPIIAGGRDAFTPMAGDGCDRIGDALHLTHSTFEQLGDNVYVHGRVSRKQQLPPATMRRSFE